MNTMIDTNTGKLVAVYSYCFDCAVVRTIVGGIPSGKPYSVLVSTLVTMKQYAAQIGQGNR